MAEEPAVGYDGFEAAAGAGAGAVGAEDNLSMSLGDFMAFLETEPAPPGEGGEEEEEEQQPGTGSSDVLYSLEAGLLHTPGRRIELRDGQGDVGMVIVAPAVSFHHMHHHQLVFRDPACLIRTWLAKSAAGLALTPDCGIEIQFWQLPPHSPSSPALRQQTSAAPAARAAALIAQQFAYVNQGCMEIAPNTNGSEDLFQSHEEMLENIEIWSNYTHVDPSECQVEVNMELNEGEQTIDHSEASPYVLINGEKWKDSDIHGNQSGMYNLDNQHVPRDASNHANFEEATGPLHELSNGSYLGQRTVYDQTEHQVENNKGGMKTQMNTYFSGGISTEQSALSSEIQWENADEMLGNTSQDGDRFTSMAMFSLTHNADVPDISCTGLNMGEPTDSICNGNSSCLTLQEEHRQGEYGKYHHPDYISVDMDISQPKSEANPPDGLLAVPLLRHQKIALSWMVQKETSSPHCSGGILADDQGLGKTVSTISLILTERPPVPQSSTIKKETFEAVTLDDDDEDDCDEPDLKKQMQTCSSELTSNTVKQENPIVSVKTRPAAGTLVVCPTSVLRQWAGELKNKVTSKANLSFLIYHGSNRTKDPDELTKYDVVLTTYSIVSMEVPKQSNPDSDDEEKGKPDRYGAPVSSSGSKKRKPSSSKKAKNKSAAESSLPEKPLAKVAWFRVILDEAQSIKNYRTQVARACWGLRAKRRWCLSGTPIQNAVEDLYSYFRFLRYDPYAVYKQFCSLIKIPISRNPTNGYKKLQVVLKTVMLRRTKATMLDGKPIISLPPKTVSLKTVDFTSEERNFYNTLEVESREQFKKRSWFLTNIWILQDAPEDAVVTICGHVFCNQCILEQLTGDDSICPVSNCRVRLNSTSLFSRGTLECSLTGLTCDFKSNDTSMEMVHGEKRPGIDSSYASSKVRAALDILLSLPKIDPTQKMDSKNLIGLASENFEGKGSSEQADTKLTEKAIVFSQWTRMLDLLEVHLKASHVTYRRLDGTMSVAARDKAVKDFNTVPEVTVMIMSLKAASLGLNMVAACHVLMLDLWWNPTTEDQAVDRAHRIGQTRPVTVSRLTIKDTVEDRILALQEKKREMVASAFGEDRSGSRQSRLTVEDLNYLFMV
nr:unnamed protein product [Digitaria exilis]